MPSRGAGAHATATRRAQQHGNRGGLPSQERNVISKIHAAASLRLREERDKRGEAEQPDPIVAQMQDYVVSSQERLRSGPMEMMMFYTRKKCYANGTQRRSSIQTSTVISLICLPAALPQCSCSAGLSHLGSRDSTDTRARSGYCMASTDRHSLTEEARVCPCPRRCCIPAPSVSEFQI